VCVSRSAVIDGTGYEGFREKVVKDFVPTYAAEACVWPFFQARPGTRVWDPEEHLVRNI
jgi:hypothetical protein